MNKLKEKTLLSGMLILLTLVSCNKEEFFDKELYQKMIYIVSGQYNVDAEEFSFEEKESVRNISFSSSGSEDIDQDIIIDVKPDDVLLPIYNKANFDQDEQKFAKILNPAYYKLGSNQVILKKGEPNVSLPVFMTASQMEKLSPDSIYFIPLKISNVSHYTVNEKKKNVLFRVQTSNRYAQTKKKTFYSLKGYKIDTVGNTVNNVLMTSTSKQMLPLSKNEVRIYIGNTNLTAPTVPNIKRNALVLKINENNSVNIRAYEESEAGLMVQQLARPADEPDFVYLNTYVPTKDKERFLLYYRYKTYDTLSKQWSRWFYMKEDLRKLE